MEISRWDGVFNVTIKRLKKEDAGGYLCAVEENFKALYQEVNLQVLDGTFLVIIILDMFINFTADGLLVLDISKHFRMDHFEYNKPNRVNCTS